MPMNRKTVAAAMIGLAVMGLFAGSTRAEATHKYPLDILMAQACFKTRFTVVALKVEPMEPIRLKGGTTDIYMLAAQIEMLALVGLAHKQVSGKEMSTDELNAYADARMEEAKAETRALAENKTSLEGVKQLNLSCKVMLEDYLPGLRAELEVK